MKNHTLKFKSLCLKPLMLFGCMTLLLATFTAQPSQPAADEAMLKNIYREALSNSRCYDWLEYLTQRIGHRLSGSANAEKAVIWSHAMLDTLGLDSVWLQPVRVPRWVRGETEQVWVEDSPTFGNVQLSALALGGSVGLTHGVVRGTVVEVKSWEALDSLGKAGVLQGKIVFYNRPMDPTHLHTFDAYGGAVDQRSSGASRAAKYNAIGVLVRSMGLKIDGYPHTGSLRYDSAYALIPAAAVSTYDAERLSRMLKMEPNLRISMDLKCAMLGEAQSYNVIGEIRGTERPKDIIVVGGHLDSWDVGQGAHDDGAGCVQSMDVLRYLKKIGYRPRHTVRCVLFMNEENGLRGGRQYAAEAKRKNEFHLCAIESDAGGFTPRGFTFEADDSVFDKFFERIQTLEPLLAPYELYLKKGGSGADIGPLRVQKGLLCGYRPDSQRYFDYHHTAADVFSAVNRRELELGAAGMAALVYLLDKYGL